MTKKLAVFVEGQTEQIFVERFIKEVAKEEDVDLVSRTLSGHGLVSLTSIPASKKPYSVLVFDCQNDEKVKSVILERRASLGGKGYSLILGLRDLYPEPLSKIPVVKAGIAYGLPTSPPITKIFLSVVEIEAWFLQEKEHYGKVDPGLDYTTFKAQFGFDPVYDSAESVLRPPELLKKIYRTVGKTYKKKRFHVERTVNALDMAELCYGCNHLIPHFDQFSAEIHGFFS